MTSANSKMMRVRWLGVAIAIAGLTRCGAMSLEPLAPEEPPQESVTAPRLMRPDAGAGADAMQPTNEEHL